MSHKLSQRQTVMLQQFAYGSEYPVSEILNFRLNEEVSLATVKRDLTEMIELGYLRMEGELKGSKYMLTSYGLLHRDFLVGEYFANPSLRKNSLPSYNFELLEMISRVDLFSAEELSILEEGTKKFEERGRGSSEVIIRKELERFVIELSWKSSKIEGNTYTLLDTEKLIREGIESPSNTRDEAIMILNHKKSFSYILELIEMGKSLQTFRELENIHRLLVEGFGIDHGLRKKAVGITGTGYLPLDVGSQIEEETKKLVECIAQKKDFFSKALLAVLGVSYLQAFEDGNKRTGRLFANAMLMEGKLAPLSYRDVDEKEYREAVLIFYEQNSIEPFKKIFMEQYLFSCKNYNLG